MYTTPVPPDIPLLYCDDAVVVVAKPTRMAVHRGWAAEGPFAMMLVRDQLESWVFPVHRLDAATSGVLLFGRSSEHAAVLCAQFAARTVEKRYLALTRGVTAASGVIDHPMANEPRKRDRPDDAEYKPAVTRFTRRWVFRDRYSWLEARPETGRPHQIRRHFKHISHPLIGDVRYGKGDHNRLFRREFGLHRLALHAASLGFDHPVTGERLTIEAPLPTDLLEPLTAMGWKETTE